MMKEFAENDLLVFSHLRWNFVFQRPQHLMSRYAKQRRVFFIEEPVFEDVSFPKIHTHQSEEGVFVITPYLPHALANEKQNPVLETLVDELLLARNIRDYSVWYYTPMSLQFTRHLKPKNILFDIMDELSLFKDAPQLLKQLEEELFQKADLVFTGGKSLHDAKRFRHKNIHSFPSSIDKTHFGKARKKMTDPADQEKIPHPRIGFFGVIDERTDLHLLTAISKLHPEFHFIMLGPVVKIDPATLPISNNIHYLGQKNYRELPGYVSGWDAAMMPFALNESTRFISPTKTPEFLAAGLPVVSTAIEDVVTPYGDEDLVYIASNPEEFANALTCALKDKANIKWKLKVDSFLADISWDITWKNMALLEQQIEKKIQFKEHDLRKINSAANYKPNFVTTNG